jgi:hypothetical protein
MKADRTQDKVNQVKTNNGYTSFKKLYLYFPPPIPSPYNQPCSYPSYLLTGHGFPHARFLLFNKVFDQPAHRVERGHSHGQTKQVAYRQVEQVLLVRLFQNDMVTTTMIVCGYHDEKVMNVLLRI